MPWLQEKNTPVAIDTLGPKLKHVHLSENDRGILGTGQIDFSAINNALRQNQYDRCVIVEGFGYNRDEPSAPGYLWTDQRITPELFAAESMAYLRRSRFH